MTLGERVQILAEQSVLCWLATSSSSGRPSVSPKEVFAVYEGNSIVIANIASPTSARNIRENPWACVSFVNVFTQKGYQVRGAAAYLTSADEGYDDIERALLGIAGEGYPFKSVFRVMGDETKEILAPRYRLYPETTEAQQIESAMASYGVRAMRDS